MISIVAAMGENRVIGDKERIPWRLRDDLVHLKHLTQGHTVIIGRKSFESMAWYYDKSGRPMPGKTYIVVTRNPAFASTRENVQVAHSLPDALEQATKLGDPDIFVNGGASIYTEALPYVTRIYLTKVYISVDGDAFFPELDMAQWQEISREHHTKDEKNDHDFDIIVLKKRQEG